MARRIPHTASRSPRTSPKTPAEATRPDQPLHALPDPDNLSEDQVAALADDITSLVNSRGWQWLQDYAQGEFGSRGLRARLRAKMADNATLEEMGAYVMAQLAAGDAAEMLIAAPKRLIDGMRIELARRKQMREQQARTSR